MKEISKIYENYTYLIEIERKKMIQSCDFMAKFLIVFVLIFL
jgi:hypothetical protein